MSTWDMEVRTRGERKERLARVAELRRNVSADLVFLHRSEKIRLKLKFYSMDNQFKKLV